MKTLRLLLPSVLLLAGPVGLPLPVQAQPPIPGPAYLRSSLGPPWGVSANEDAMDRAFGAGQWRDLRFESVSMPSLLSESTCLFLEGGDQGAQALENFLTAHLPAIENWVSAGGVLFVNAAPNVGDGMSFGFGVTLTYFDGTGSARAANLSHPVFNGPFTPVGGFWSGSIGHATVSGPDLLPLILNQENSRLVLAEKAFGRGWVLFGGMTTDNFHSPQPEAHNLRANILAYANEQVNPPTNQPPEILTQPASQAVLAGQTVTFRAVIRGTRPLQLQWYFNGQSLAGATNATLILDSVTPNQAGGYKLVAGNALGTVTSERATLAVSLQGPRIVSHPTDRFVQAGEDVTFTVVATGGPLYYQWRHNDVELPGATNATLFLTAVTTNDAGAYQVIVSNLLGYVTSVPARLTVDQFAPTIFSEPSDVSAASGDNVHFYVGANGAPPPRYQWRYNGVDLSGETNETLFLSNIATNQAGGYSAVVANVSGSVTSRVAILTVNEFPASITSHPASQTVSAGSDVAFYVGVAGTPPLRFQWRFNGTNLPGETNASLFLPAVHPNRAGVYTVAVSNHLGGAISFPATLTVLGGAPPVFTSQPANFTLLVGGSVTLIAVASGQPAPSYQWRFNGVDLPGATLSFLALVNVTTNQAGNYTVVASNLFGTATSRVAVVTVNLQAPIISTQPVSRTVEAGSTVVFNVTATAGPPPTYQWLFNGEPLAGARSSSLVLSNVLPSRAGLYSVIVSNELGSATSDPATLTINAAAPVITTQPASRTVLDGSNAVFTVSATGIPQVTFQWRFNGVAIPGRTTSVLALTSVSTNAAGEYTVVVSNLLGVVVSEPAILTVTQHAPVITAQTTNRTVAVGANVLFQVQAVAGPRPTYQWQRDGVNLPGATASSLVVSNVTRAHEGLYTVVVSNPLGSVTSQPIRLTVIYQPPVITGHPTNRAVLAGATATFAVTTTGSPPFFYQWRFNGEDLPGGTNQTLVLPGVMTNQAGGYSVVVTNFGGAATSTVATLTVTQQPPVITTQPANRTVAGGTNVTFTVIANGAPPPTYQWRFLPAGQAGIGANLPGATNAQLLLTNVGTNQAGGYSVVVSNLAGSITSRVATLTVIIQATVILVQPADRTVRPGRTATFTVIASGTPPLLYQWDYNGDDIPGATNATLILDNVTLDQEGSYRVTVTGAGGSVVSRKAELMVREPTTRDFFITGLLTTNARLIEHGFITGDDRGGIATSSSRVFYSGDSQTAGFALADLSGATGAGRLFDALTGDLNTGTVYTLGAGLAPLGQGGDATSLIEVNGVTGQLTTNLVILSERITLQNGAGLFAGYDQIALFTGTRVVSIELPSGLVTDHGSFSMPTHAFCESWAFWGVAETIDDELYLAYVRDSQTIARVRVSDGVVEPIATFSSLSDMCSFTLSLSLNRWYFHHEGSSQFGGGDESIGYADATWELIQAGPPFIRQQPQSLSLLAGQTAEFSVLASGTRPLFHQWRREGTELPGATNQTLLQANVGTNHAGAYIVVITNALGAVTSQVATLTVQLLPPSILAQPVGRTAFEGAQVRFSVIATGAPPPAYQWQFNGMDIAGATNPVLTLTSVTTNDAGNYRVRVSNDVGAVTSDSASLIVRAGTNVVTALIIWDDLNPNTLSLRDALAAAGIQVELSDTSETGYNGTNPSLEGFSAVIHLNGTTYDADMPTAGQDALVQFVQGGGGFLQAEWNAYEIAQGRMARMRDLTLFDRVDAYRDGDNTWVIVPEQVNHPVVANVPASFTFRTDFHFSPVHSFATDPVTVLMRDPEGHDAVAVREFGLGRIVGFQHAGNYDQGSPPPYDTLANPNIQQLYIDGVLWVSGGGTANLPPSIAIPLADRIVALGRTVTLRVGARGTRPLSYQWRFNGTDLAGATNSTLVISNAAFSHAGSYAVVVTNVFGAVTSAPAVLTVREVTTVGVFDDPNYVDTHGGNEAESDTLQASLQSLEYDVATFTAIEVGAAENSLMVFPEFETGDLELNLSQTDRQALEGFVAGGGGLILHGTPGDPGRDARFLNTVFGFSVQAAQEGAGTSFALTDEAADTSFADNVPTLSAEDGSAILFKSSLPPEALSLYEQSDRSLVVEFMYGNGRVIFLGWDWYNAAPLGSVDNGWLEVLDSAVLEASSGATVSNQPPSIAVQPANRTALRGGTATFRVVARGSRPVTYQWQLNGLNLPGATNAVLVLTDLSPAQAGAYTVVVSNPFGTATSQPALLSVLDTPVNAPFRITSLTPGNSRVVEHDFLTGDDRGGIAASRSHVFYSGDNSTARFALGDLSGGTSLGRIYDAMVSNLRTETVYSLGDGVTPILIGGGTVTTLIEIDGETGDLTSNTIGLSEPVIVNEPTGIFAGYDQVVLWTRGQVYSIHLPTGLVTPLGALNLPEFHGCENWAFWGVAENFDGAAHLVYVRNTESIVRTRVPDGSTEVVATFGSLSDMCSFTLSLSLNRWYFHHEGGSQFGGSSETIGYADATWEFPVPPVPPGITQPPQSVDGLWGGSALFQVAASGPLLSYQWSFNNAPLLGATAASLLLSNLTPAQAGQYAVVVRNPFGSITSAPVSLTVSALAPVITSPPASQSAVLGADVFFAAEITAAPQAALQWFFNNAALPGATNATLLLTNVSLSAAGSYRIVADNFAGSAISPVATLSILPQVPLPVALDSPGQPWTTGGDALWVGQPFLAHDGVDAAESGVLFDDEASWVQTTVVGPGQVSFWWKVSSEADYDELRFWILDAGSQIPASSIEYPASSLQAAISGEVDWQRQVLTLSPGAQSLRWAYLKDGSVSVGADRAWLDEVRLELAPRIVSQPASRTVGEGGSTSFSVVAEGSAPLSYQWLFCPNLDAGCSMLDAGIQNPESSIQYLAGETNATLIVTNAQPGDQGFYRVVVSNPVGSVSSSNATLTVVAIAPLVVGISRDGNLEERNALAGTLTNQGFVVRFIIPGNWAGLDVVVSYPGDGIGPSVPEIASGVNYVQISDWGSDWTPNNWVGIADNANITILLNEPHPITSGLPPTWSSKGFWFYGSVGSDYVGWSDDTSLPSLASETRLANHSRVLVANTLGEGRAVFIGWNVYGPAAHTNDVTLLRNALSWASGTPVVPTPPLITQPPASQTVPAGSSASFTVVAVGSVPLSYQWHFNGTAIAGATNQSLTLDYALPNHAGEYTVVVSNSLGTALSPPAALTVTVQAPVITMQPASQTALGGSSVALSVVAVGVPAPTYQWRLNGADIPGATNATLALHDVTAAHAGTYKVVVRNVAGTVTSLPARLTVNIVPPQITLQPVSQTVLRGTNVTFAVSATGAPPPAYQWRFNDTDLAGQTGPSLTILQPTAASAGRYTVRVSNDGGAVISEAAELTIVESIALAEALDQAGVIWRSGGSAPWFGQPMTSRDGVDAASSGGTADNRESWLETTVTGPGTVSFWWKVSSELGFDRLNFSVGNQSLASVTGETDWQTHSFPLSDGPQNLRWNYAKDGSARDGADAGWLDQVVITTSPALIVRAVIVGADVRLSFPTSPGRRYRVERADALTPTIEWQPVAGAEDLLGTGVTLEVLDSGGAGTAQRFYRVALLP